MPRVARRVNSGLEDNEDGSDAAFKAIQSCSVLDISSPAVSPSRAGWMKADYCRCVFLHRSTHNDPLSINP